MPKASKLDAAFDKSTRPKNIAKQVSAASIFVMHHSSIAFSQKDRKLFAGQFVAPNVCEVWQSNLLPPALRTSMGVAPDIASRCLVITAVDLPVEHVI